MSAVDALDAVDALEALEDQEPSLLVEEASVNQMNELPRIITAQ